MSLFDRPVIFLPGGGDWNPSRRFRVSTAPRQKLRRRPYSRHQASRHPFDYLFGVDPFDDLYVDDDPEENVYDMFDPPASYSSGQPRRIYVYETKKNPDHDNPELVMRNKFVPQTRKAEESRKESRQSTDGERETTNRNGDVVVMDLDELAGRFLRSFYDIDSKSRNERKREMVKPRVAGGEEREKRVGKEATKKKSSQTTTTSQSQSVKEKLTESDNKRNEVEERKSGENEKINDDMTTKERSVVISEKKNGENDEREKTNSDDVQLIFVVEDNAGEEENNWCVVDGTLKDKRKEYTETECETASDHLMDCSRDVSRTEERGIEGEREDVCQKTTESDHRSEEEKSDDDVEIEEQQSSNADDVHEPMESGDLGRKVTEEGDECDKFQMTFDLSSFRPEEIQVKLSDARLILDAVHEDIKEGLIEKRSVQKVITLPPGVDTDSLRCLLGDDGHMTISANYLEKRKESKILTIEMQTS